MGIFSIVLFIIISVKEFIIGTTYQKGIGMILASFILVAGILEMIKENNKELLITSIAIYIIGGIFGFANSRVFVDLKICSSLNLIFGIVLLIYLLFNKNKYAKK